LFPFGGEPLRAVEPRSHFVIASHMPVLI